MPPLTACELAAELLLFVDRGKKTPRMPRTNENNQLVAFSHDTFPMFPSHVLSHSLLSGINFTGENEGRSEEKRQPV